jgi:hypothetical protein
MTEDQLHTLSRELQKRDPRFLRILSTNPAEGQGEYEVRSLTGQTGRLTFTFEGTRVVTPLFNQEVTARMAAEAAAVPDPYAAPLAAMRASHEARSTDFEREWKKQRLAALKAEHERWKQP